MKKGFADFEAFNDRIDEDARAKIASLSKKVPEGSDKWKILYTKYRAEILKKQKIPNIK